MTATPTSNYSLSFGGTSAASPHAAGVAALALSMNPDRNYLRLRRVLQRTSRDLGDPGKDDDFGRGFVSANSTMRFPTRRVTFRSNGEEANGASRDPALNTNGRFTVFASDATNLRGNDTNSASDCFVHDRDTARTLPLSVNSAGDQANGASDRPRISGDGARVVFDSDATNLATDTNTQTDVFLHDRDPDGNGVFDEGNGTTVRVSVATGGTEAVGGPSTHGVVSDDGNFVLFASAATNLVGSDGNGVADIFFHDVAGVTTTRVSVDTGGGDPDGASSWPDLSADMSVATFASEATDLIASDGNLDQDVFVRDLVGMTTERVSVATGGTEATGWSGEPSISGDGNLVAFSSDATDLVTGDGNGRRDVFLRDRLANTTVRVSVASGGGELNGDSSHPSISDDGTQVAFQSDAPELGGTLGSPRVYVHDLTTGITMLVSRYDLSHEGTGAAPVMSGNGTTVAFESEDSSMTPNDGNAAQDVYLFQDTPCDPPVITTHPSDALNVPIGTTVTFSAMASGTQAFYQWRKDGMAIPRAIGIDYVVEALSVGDAGTYDCVVTNYCGAETSIGAILTLDATGVGETAGILPSELLLEPAVPNPFVASTSIRFAVPQSGPVLVTVYDVAGRRVATLWNGPREAGWHRFDWSGVDDHGHAAAAGVYFLRVETGGGVSQHKVVRLN
jgi:Tol biopolymer transport system component